EPSEAILEHRRGPRCPLWRHFPSRSAAIGTQLKTMVEAVDLADLASRGVRPLPPADLYRIRDSPNACDSARVSDSTFPVPGSLQRLAITSLFLKAVHDDTNCSHAAGQSQR